LGDTLDAVSAATIFVAKILHKYCEEDFKMEEAYDLLLTKWAEKMAQAKKYRALYKVREDCDYLDYANRAEEEAQELERALDVLERGLR
jgi:hypothetical protein